MPKSKIDRYDYFTKQQGKVREDKEKLVATAKDLELDQVVQIYKTFLSRYSCKSVFTFHVSCGYACRKRRPSGRRSRRRSTGSLARRYSQNLLLAKFENIFLFGLLCVGIGKYFLCGCRIRVTCCSHLRPPSPRPPASSLPYDFLVSRDFEI